VPELGALVAAISVELQQTWKHAKQRTHEQHATIAILQPRCVDDGPKQQALRVYQDMTLLALDLFARVVAMRINRAPPFSALCYSADFLYRPADQVEWLLAAAGLVFFGGGLFA
jgi:hypothetical protein